MTFLFTITIYNPKRGKAIKLRCKIIIYRPSLLKVSDN